MLSVIRNKLKTQALNCIKLLHTTNAQSIEDRKKNYKRPPGDDEGAQGEKILDLDSMLKIKQSIFPTLESDNLLFDGILYKNIPICNVRVSQNNTVITVTDKNGKVKMTRSCGVDGFKNTKKGTNIAAQTTAINMAMKALENGYKTVRVRVRGLGPGRLSALKGLQMGGLNIVSVTDNTRVSWNPPRARKARRL